MAVRAETQIDLARVDDGTDGVSPTATVTKTGDTATITITDVNQTTTASVSDGTDGTNGVSVTAVEPQYYLSTSDTSATGGSWSSTPATFVSGRYYWTRDYITFSDGTHDTSTEVYNSGMTKAAQDAYDAKTLADDTNQYFWYAPTGADTGAHITEVPQDEWNDSTDPNYHSGGNLLARSNGIAVRDGMDELAIFGASGLTIQTYDNNDTVGIAHLGYGESNNEGVEENSPYYTFGKRKATNTPYSSSATYAIGDLCIYNDKTYVCITEITTPEAWNGGHWQLAYGAYSVAEGIGNISSDSYAHAEGYYAIASGYSSHAEGGRTKALGGYAHAEGMYTFAIGGRSHAEGSSTTADGYAAHAEGESTRAKGYNSHAEGKFCSAYGDYAHAQNCNTAADSDCQTAIGKYNKADPYDRYAFIIGNGDENTQSNALTVDWNGKIQTPQMQAGTIAATSVSANSYTDVSVTFSSVMSGTPIVVCGVVSTSTAGAIGSITAAVTSTSTTGFTCRIFNAGSTARTPAVNWIAMNV